MPDVALRAEFGLPDRLMRQMAEGILDIGVMYTPQLRPGLEVELLFEDELVLVSTQKDPGPDLDDRYVFVDWGPEFQAVHSLRFPHHTNTGLTLSRGAPGLRYVLDEDRSGYFPQRMVRRYLDRGRLHRVPKAPVFPYPAYAVYHMETPPEVLAPAMSDLRRIAARVDRRRKSKARPG